MLALQLSHFLRTVGTNRFRENETSLQFPRLMHMWDEAAVWLGRERIYCALQGASLDQGRFWMRDIKDDWGKQGCDSGSFAQMGQACPFRVGLELEYLPLLATPFVLPAYGPCGLHPCLQNFLLICILISNRMERPSSGPLNSSATTRVPQ